MIVGALVVIVGMLSIFILKDRIFKQYPIESESKYLIYYRSDGKEADMREHCSKKHGVFDHCDVGQQYDCSQGACPFGMSPPQPCCRL
jgi:hypothetical protein